MKATRVLLGLALLAAAGCAGLKVQVGGRSASGTAASAPGGPILGAAGTETPAADRDDRDAPGVPGASYAPGTAGSGTAPAEGRPKKAPGSEEAALQTALQYVESQQHSYRISSADLIEITVYQEAELNRQVRVSPEGIITLPLVGQIKVAGLGVADAEEAVREKLKKFVIDPQVSVFIKEYGNKQVYVLGEVAKPGSYPLPTEAPLTVIEAVTLAGGFTQYAAVDRTRVIRKVQGQSRNLEIQVSAIMKGDKSKDLQLMTNDVIYVPESFF